MDFDIAREPSERAFGYMEKSHMQSFHTRPGSAGSEGAIVAILLFLVALSGAFLTLLALLVTLGRLSNGLDWRKGLRVTAILAVMTVAAGSGVGVLFSQFEAKEAAAKAKAAAQEAVDDQNREVAEAKQVKIDARDAMTAGLPVEVFTAVRDKGWAGYAGERCQAMAINSATYGWDADQPFNGPSVIEENDQIVALVGHDIKFKNSFGAEGKGKYTCSVDKKTGKITLLDSGIDPSAGI